MAFSISRESKLYQLKTGFFHRFGPQPIEIPRRECAVGKARQHQKGPCMRRRPVGSDWFPPVVGESGREGSIGPLGGGMQIAARSASSESRLMKSAGRVAHSG